MRGFVLDAGLEGWEQAFKRAEQLMVNRTEVSTYTDDDGHSEVIVLVDSATREGERHAARFYIAADGTTRVRCTCEACEYGRRCWHIAAGMIRLGWRPRAVVAAVVEPVAIAAA
jgi:hypothetical protein